METNTFEYIWSLLNPQGEYKRRRHACERLWQGYDDNKQRNIYIRIKAKLRQGEFVHFPRGFTVLSSMAHRTFYVYYVRIGFGQRLFEPPYIDHAWSISLRFCPLSPRFYRTLIDGTPYFLRLLRPNRIRTTALRAAIYRPCLVDLPGFPLFSYIYENQSRGPHRNQRSVSYGESMEKAIDFCFRTGGTAGSVVTTQIAAGVAFMAPSAIRCDRLAEGDLSLSAAFLPQLAALFLSLCRL